MGNQVVLEERRDMYLVLHNGIVKGVAKSPLSILRFERFGGGNIELAGNGIEIREVEGQNGVICSMNGKDVFVPFDITLINTINEILDTGKIDKIVWIHNLYDVIEILKANISRGGSRIRFARDGTLQLMNKVAISVKEYERYSDGSFVAKFLFSDEISQNIFAGHNEGVALGGKDETGQYWMHFVPPEYKDKSIKDCELWIAGGEAGDTLISTGVKG